MAITGASASGSSLESSFVIADAAGANGTGSDDSDEADDDDNVVSNDDFASFRLLDVWADGRVVRMVAVVAASMVANGIAISTTATASTENRIVNVSHLTEINVVVLVIACVDTNMIFWNWTHEARGGRRDGEHVSVGRRRGQERERERKTMRGKIGRKQKLFYIKMFFFSVLEN